MHLAGLGNLRRFVEGDLLFEEGHRPNGLYMWLERTLNVYSDASSNREVVYNILAVSEFLGGMLLDGTRSASFNAITDARCSVIGSYKLRELIRTQPTLQSI